jgi:hypothetical protein
MTNPSEVPEHNRYSYVEHSCSTVTPGCFRCDLGADEVEPGSGGEDAIRREVEACIEEEGFDIERTDLAREEFKRKMAYWREKGAPPYHGPKAVS